MVLYFHHTFEVTYIINLKFYIWVPLAFFMLTICSINLKNAMPLTAKRQLNGFFFLYKYVNIWMTRVIHLFYHIRVDPNGWELGVELVTLLLISQFLMFISATSMYFGCRNFGMVVTVHLGTCLNDDDLFFCRQHSMLRRGTWNHGKL